MRRDGAANCSLCVAHHRRSDSDLLRNGFPAHLHYKTRAVESPVDFFDDVSAPAEWDAVVRYDALSKVFQVYRVVAGERRCSETFPDVASAEAAIDAPSLHRFDRRRRERRPTTISFSTLSRFRSLSSMRSSSGCAASSSRQCAERKIRAPLLVAASGL